MTEPEIGMTVRLHTPERGYRRPFTGAWIETAPVLWLWVRRIVAPSQGRGLKHP